MANLSRFDPFKMDVNDSLEDVFEGFFRPVLSKNQASPQIQLDVEEDQKQYKIHADIPGVKKEDIHVEVDGNIVNISAEMHREEEEKKDTKVIRSERYFGKVSRSFALGTDLDESQANAEYKDGVLELVLPKKAGGTSKRLKVR